MRARDSVMNYSFTVPSVLILLVVMGYYFFRPRLPIRLNRAFLAILVIDICTVLLDFVSSRLNETWTEHAPALLWIFNILFYVFYFSRIYMFYVFTVSVLDTRGAPRSALHYTPIAYFACAGLAVTSPLVNWLFYVDRGGFHEGPLHFLIYACAGIYLIFSLWIVITRRRYLSRYELVGLLGLQVILLAGNITRIFLPNFLVMNTFCLMAILVLYLSFMNPDFFLSERGYVYNLPAFRAMLNEQAQRKTKPRMLAFVLNKYNEHREIFGGQRMDEVLVKINQYLAGAFPHLRSFYLRNGIYVIIGPDMTNTDRICAELEKRFAEAWETETGELAVKVSFLRVDQELKDCPVDRLVNTLLISLDEIGQGTHTGNRHNLTDSMNEISRKLDIRRCLENALERDELEVYLQPIVDSRTGKGLAAEALVRLKDENGKIIPPNLFINLAEREGYIERLGEQVLAKVCRFLRDHDTDRIGLQWVNVNLSPNQFTSQRTPGRFAAILEEYGISPLRIHLELTEESMIDFSLLHEQVENLHAKGFEFSLDDYGSGYSNLTRVRRYPFSNIKIDMEVVRNFCRDQDPLLPALIRGFKEMGLSVTAEGIETKEMADLLRGIGCDYFQGYYFSRPMPMENFPDWAVKAP